MKLKNPRIDEIYNAKIKKWELILHDKNNILYMREDDKVKLTLDSGNKVELKYSVLNENPFNRIR